MRLFLDDGERWNLTQKFAQRASCYLGEDKTERQELYSFFEEIYNNRSGAVHRGISTERGNVRRDKGVHQRCAVPMSPVDKDCHRAGYTPKCQGVGNPGFRGLLNQFGYDGYWREVFDLMKCRFHFGFSLGGSLARLELRKVWGRAPELGSL